MLFDGPADLPTATLRSRASEARHRVIAADLHGWLAHRWRWVRPRTVPLLVAFVGMLAVLGATKYLSVYAYREQPTPHSWNCVHGHADHSSLVAAQPGGHDPAGTVAP